MTDKCTPSELPEVLAEAGEQVDRALKRLAAAAPAFMVFNGIPVEAEPGENADQLWLKWDEGWRRIHREREEERRKAEQKAQAEIDALRAVAKAAAAFVDYKFTDETGHASAVAFSRVEQGLRHAVRAWREVVQS